MNNNVLSLSNVVAHYVGVTRDEWYLDIPDLSVEAGEICLVSGDNMSGKSTLLKLAAGMGDGLVIEGAVSQLGAAVTDLRRLGERSIILSSDDEMFPELSVLENVAVALTNAEMSTSARQRIERLLADAGVFAGHTVHTPLGALSSGGRSLVKFCRALVSDHPLILMDEITSFLDEARSQLILNTLIDFARAQRAIMIVSHSERDRAFLAARFAVRFFHLSRKLNRSLLAPREVDRG